MEHNNKMGSCSHKETLLNTNKVISLDLLPSKTRETTFQTQNNLDKQHGLQIRIVPDPTCLYCKEPENIEHLLYACANFSAMIWALACCTLTLGLSHHTGDYNPSIALASLEIVYNKPHPSILLHLQATIMQKVLILFFQEVKLDIIFRHAQLKAIRRQELQMRKQAYLLSVLKISKLPQRQSVITFFDALSFLRTRSLFHE
jgi:hypothetical protein